MSGDIVLRGDKIERDKVLEMMAAVVKIYRESWRENQLFDLRCLLASNGIKLSEFELSEFAKQMFGSADELDDDDLD